MHQTAIWLCAVSLCVVRRLGCDRWNDAKESGAGTGGTQLMADAHHLTPGPKSEPLPDELQVCAPTQSPRQFTLILVALKGGVFPQFLNKTK